MGGVSKISFAFVFSGVRGGLVLLSFLLLSSFWGAVALKSTIPHFSFRKGNTDLKEVPLVATHRCSRSWTNLVYVGVKFTEINT